jgi:hypothetical protein
VSVTLEDVTKKRPEQLAAEELVRLVSWLKA